MVRFADKGDIDRIRELMKSVFKDPDEFLAFYFSRIYTNGLSLIVEHEGELAASMQILPYDLKVDERIVKAGYIFGAMTHPEYRRQGYMSKLLQTSFQVMKEQGMEASFLIPQEEWLFDFYSAYGYMKAFPIAIDIVRVDDRIKSTVQAFVVSEQMEMGSIYSALQDRMPRVVRKTASQANLLIDEFVLSGGEVFASPQGIALAYKSGKKVWVKELLAEDVNNRNALLQRISLHYQQTDLRLLRYSKIKRSVYYGMLKPLHDNFVLSPDIYMSMMFD